MSPNKWLATVWGSDDRSWVRPGQNPQAGASRKEAGSRSGRKKWWTENLRRGSGKGPDSWGPSESRTVSRRSAPRWTGAAARARGEAPGENLLSVICPAPGVGGAGSLSGGQASRARVESLAKWPSQAGKEWQPAGETRNTADPQEWRPEPVAVLSRQRWQPACRRDQRSG
ncbi:hypothetical protein NDU88_001043 [Pleurodeles waltl]|uniref:Uncharacterized protein n=1 Tax=Pleurodeles waltl TaxID=8319 RepID=A0AAV7M455_PLEWA|nr:hypothetical protein NDU88_001043 [Pleurodeles waltl]